MRFSHLPIVLAAVLVGCSGKGEQPVTPSQPDVTAPSSVKSVDSTHNPRWILGYWDIRFSSDRSSVEVIPRRIPAMHLNAVRLLQENPCKDCLRINDVEQIPPDEVKLEVRLRHPFPKNPKFTAFDVRGIFITGSDYAFPASGRRIAWGANLPTVINPFGYTALFNPTEFPESKPGPPALRYIPGHFAPGGDLTATLNPFISFGWYSYGNPRGIFEGENDEVNQHAHLKLPNGVEGFGYAVDACWQLVEGEITDPESDFPPDANCLEAYRIKELLLENELTPASGSSSRIGFQIYDHQGLETISAVMIEAPDLFDGERELSYTAEDCYGGYVFSGDIVNEKGAGDGVYPLLVRVIDSQQDQNLGQVDAWQAARIGISRGWVRHWADCGWSFPNTVSVDPQGNICVSGSFGGEADFDPGPGNVQLIGDNGFNGFLSKFTSGGKLLWATDLDANCNSHYVNKDSEIYVAGCFWKTTDFDPGSGVEIRTPIGKSDAYLAKFDANGEFLWVKTWGGTYVTFPVEAVEDPGGNVYVAGYFYETVDFDPGPGVDEHTDAGASDIYLSKFDSSGDFQWVRTWGDIYVDMPSCIAADSMGSIYLAGGFNGCPDGVSDPVLTPIAFLDKVGSDGVEEWTRTWPCDPGGIGIWDIAVSDLGCLFNVGRVWGDIDLDPGAGIDPHDPNINGAFLSRFSLLGEYAWTRFWGGPSWTAARGLSVDVDGLGNPYLVGLFKGTQDFDPGPDLYEMTATDAGDLFANGNRFLSSFDQAGNFILARSWDDGSTCGGISIDSTKSIYVAGDLNGLVDFDPGPSYEFHTQHEEASYLLRLHMNGLW